MEQLKGVTLESVVIATHAAKYVRCLAERGIVKLSDFPMITHINEIINSGAMVDIPWKAFESEKI